MLNVEGYFLALNLPIGRLQLHIGMQVLYSLQCVEGGVKGPDSCAVSSAAWPSRVFYTQRLQQDFTSKGPLQMVIWEKDSILMVCWVNSAANSPAYKKKDVFAIHQPYNLNHYLQTFKAPQASSFSSSSMSAVIPQFQLYPLLHL